MSLSAWIREFYPIKASECSEEEALDHSIKKWEGLLPENLDFYSVSINKYGELVDDHDFRFSIHGSTCALCFYHPGCIECPFVTKLGYRCDEDNLSNIEERGEEFEAPWWHWTQGHNPVPMITALKKIKELSEKE